MIGSNVFNDIPSALATPGFFLEFDNRLAASADFQGRLLVIGHALESGSAEKLETDRITSDSQADDLYGRGSQLAEMIRAARQVTRWLPVYGLAVPEDDAATASEGAIEVEGEAKGAGVLPLWIAGRRVRVPISEGDTAEEIAEAIQEAISDDGRMPVTAEIDSETATKVNLTCRWKGETGDDIDVRVDYYKAGYPKGFTLTITDMDGGAANPEMGPVIDALGDEQWHWIAMPFRDTAGLTELKDELDDRWGPMRAIDGRAFVAFQGTHGEAADFLEDHNNPHLTVMPSPPAPTPAYIWAAVNAMAAAEELQEDPSRQLRHIALPGVLPPPSHQRWTQEERNMLLLDGGATYTVDTEGTVAIERQVTTYTETNGVSDDSFMDIMTPETLSRIRFEQRAMVTLKYPRHKLATDEDRERYAEDQPVMTPGLMEEELLALYEDTFMNARSWVQDYEGYQESLRTSVDPDDSNRLHVIDSPKLIGNYMIHAQQVLFRI